MAQFNKSVTNRLTLRFAGHLPYFGIVSHVGRRSGRAYRTPVNVFRTPQGFRFALTYGEESQWVNNVIAAGRAHVLTRGHDCTFANPHLVRDSHHTYVPKAMQFMLKALRVDQFLDVDAE
jgi:deazaflavin-dependent oxidoreductase (nitroreductase family)